jgi:hypothetical protein
VLSHDYTLDSRGRRTLATHEDGRRWDYGYEMTDTDRLDAAGHDLKAQTFPKPTRQKAQKTKRR